VSVWGSEKPQLRKIVRKLVKQKNTSGRTAHADKNPDRCTVQGNNLGGVWHSHLWWEKIAFKEPQGGGLQSVVKTRPY